MPQELPGFYFDPEKNRYFPTKGPVPGSNRRNSASGRKRKYDESNSCWRKINRSSELLQSRELYGKVLFLNKRKRNFQLEYQKLQASQCKVWEYPATDSRADTGLEQFHADIQTPEGEKGTRVLLTGSVDGSFGLYEVGKVGQHFDHGVTNMPNCVWPAVIECKGECPNGPGRIRSSAEASTSLASNISCIRRIGKYSSDTVGDGSFTHHALVTTLGSGMSGGSVYFVNIKAPLDFSLSIPIERRILEIASLNCTIWTAACTSDGRNAILGTDRGAALINLERGLQSWVCRCKSDIFSQQFDQLGNVVLCGFRNGAIVEFDVRQRQQPGAVPAVLPRHRISLTSKRTLKSHGAHGQSLTKQYFEGFHPASRHTHSVKYKTPVDFWSVLQVKGNLEPSNAISLSSAVSSLVSLQSDDRYFLASSMDGFIKLYDRRLINRGAVQSYEGHVNSHTHIQLGVDPSESLVMSGGEDCCVRIWSIKSGELLFGRNISDTIVSTICWPQSGGGRADLQDSFEEKYKYQDCLYWQNHSWGAWLGSRGGLFYIHGS